MLGAVSSLLDSHAVGLHMATGAENEHVSGREAHVILFCCCCIWNLCAASGCSVTAV